MRHLIPLALIASSVCLRADVQPPRERLEPKWITARFKKLDANGDGKLSKAEIARLPWLARLDQSGDGFVSLDEALSGLAASQTLPAPTSNPPPNYAPESASPRQEPRVVKASAAGVGRMVPEAKLTLLDGRDAQFASLTGEKGTVIALVSTSCPISKRYLPSLAALRREVEAGGMSLLLVSPTATDSPEALRAAFAGAGLNAPCVIDHAGRFCQAIGANVSTDVLVLDAKRTVIYRGALDDQYGLGYSLDAPRRRYVTDALQAMRAGSIPAVQATEAPGCVLAFDAVAERASSGLTYHNRISRIIQANCESCHRTGGVAPFALQSAEQVEAKAGMIRRMVERKLMPPWFAAPPPPGAHSPWQNDRSLSDQDRQDLLAWLTAGRPIGNAADAPLPRVWPGEWQIGEPDAVFQLSKPIEVRATGTMPYQMVSVETDLPEDRWIRAIEIKPTAREVVHHVLVFVKEKGAAGRKVAVDDEGGGFFAAYVPGNDHVIFPDGFAKRLPAGASLVFQIHYTPNGAATQDQTRIGVRFSSAAPRHAIQVAGISNRRLSIPAGASNHPESATIPIKREVVILGFMPHMHLRGKAFRYELIQPDGSAHTLLDVPRYDFNWQLAYRYAEPVTVHAGSRIRATGWFDNSSGNPANPAPDKVVRWGPQTEDEMMLGYVEFYVPGAPARVAQK